MHKRLLSTWNYQYEFRTTKHSEQKPQGADVHIVRSWTQLSLPHQVQQEVFDMLAPQSRSRLATVLLELLDATHVRHSRVGWYIAQIECTVESVLDLLRHE